MDAFKNKQRQDLMDVFNNVLVPNEITQSFVNEVLDQTKKIQGIEHADWNTYAEMIVHEAREQLESPYNLGNVEWQAGRHLMIKLLVLLSVKNQALWNEVPCPALRFLLDRYNGILTISDVEAFVERCILGVAN